MFSLRQPHIWLFGVFVLVVAQAHGQPASFGPWLSRGKMPLQVDWNGDDLPVGAIARIGTVRLRHAGQIVKLLFTSDGKSLISAGGEPLIRLWDPATGREVRRFEGHAGAVSSVTLSPDGTILASVADDNVVHLWDMASGRELRRWTTEENANVQLAFAPDGKVLASTGKENSLDFWNVDTGKAIRQTKPVERERFGRWRRDDSSPATLHFSSDGRHLLHAATDGLTLWDVTTGKRSRKYESGQRGWTWHGGNLRISAADIIAWVSLSSDGQTFAVANSPDDSISLFELSSIEERGRLGDRAGPVMAVAFASDGKTLISAAADGNLRVWNAPESRLLKKIAIGTQLIRDIAIAPDQKTVALACQGGRIRLWDLMTDKERVFAEQHEPLAAVGFTANGRNVLAVDSRSILEREIATGKVVRNVTWSEGKDPSTMLLAGDRDMLVDWQPGQPIRLLDTGTGKELRCLEGKHDQWRRVNVSPDGTTVAAITHDENAAEITHLWDARTGKELPELPPRPVRATSLIFSPDGRTLVTGEADGSIRFVEVATGQERRRLRTRPGGGISSDSAVPPLVFSPDGKTLASVEGEVIRLVDITAGSVVRRFASDISISGEVVFSPDGRMIAAGTPHHAVWVWNVQNGEFLGRLEGHRGAVQRLSFAPDSKTLVSASDDGTALVWDISAALKSSRPRPHADAHAERLDSLWADLADADAARADKAIRKLAQIPEAAIGLLRDRVRPALAVDQQRIGKLLADLDNTQFAVRDKAKEALEQLHERAAPALRKALSAPSSPEVRRRVEDILEKLRRRQMPVEILRELRCLELLELIRSPEAIELVGTLSGGAPEATLTQEAKATQERLRRWANGRD